MQVGQTKENEVEPDEADGKRYVAALHGECKAKHDGEITRNPRKLVERRLWLARASARERFS